MNRLVRLGLILAGMCVLMLLGLTLVRKVEQEATRISIVATNFPGYDFARAITRGVNDVEIKMLIKPGADVHDFEPTPDDIAKIQASEMFIYAGGDEEEWVDEMLNNLDTNTQVIKMTEIVETEGDDEHVWTSLRKSQKIIEEIAVRLGEIDAENKNQYTKNAQEYNAELSEIDKEIEEIVKTAKRAEIVFGDRFPIGYFVKDYGLSYLAAFSGCSEETEASSKIVAEIIDEVKAKQIPVVFKIEMGSGMVAKEIAEATGAKILSYNAGHTVSKDDFESGKTYAEMMRDNTSALREALN